MIYFTGDVHRKVDDLLRKLDYKQISHTSDRCFAWRCWCKLF